MREESHLDDMRAAIRGDFERLAERRGGQELLSTGAEPDAQTEDPDAPSEAAPAPESAGREDGEPRERPEPVAEPPETLGEPGLDADEPVRELDGASPEPPAPAPRRSWLARLLGR